jgi:hypothetical protein
MIQRTMIQRTMIQRTLMPLALLALLACGREPQREAPPQNGKPAEPAPPAPEREEQNSTAPAPLEKDQAAPPASEFAPAPAALPAARTPPPTSAKPAPKRRAPSKGEAPSGEEGTDWAIGPSPTEHTRALRQRLDDVVKQSTPDCPSARERKQAICDLAQQICQMVDRDPDIASIESYCDDARQRCSEAEKRTAQRCT